MIKTYFFIIIIITQRKIVLITSNLNKIILKNRGSNPRSCIPASKDGSI